MKHILMNACTFPYRECLLPSIAIWCRHRPRARAEDIGRDDDSRQLGSPPLQRRRVPGEQMGRRDVMVLANSTATLWPNRGRFGERFEERFGVCALVRIVFGLGSSEGT